MTRLFHFAKLRAAKSGKENPEISQNVAHLPQKNLKIFMKVVSIHKPQFLTFYVLSAAYQRTRRKLCWGLSDVQEKGGGEESGFHLEGLERSCDH